jgi:hypothetical protein
MLVALRVVLYCTATKEKFENTEEGVRSLKKIDNSSVIYQFWDYDKWQPSNMAGEDCLGIYLPNSKWHDHKCDASLHGYICERVRLILEINFSFFYKTTTINIVIFTVDLVYLFSICGSNQLHDHIINLLKILTFILVNLTTN